MSDSDALLFFILPIHEINYRNCLCYFFTFLKFVVFFKLVKIREFLKILKFVKSEFSFYAMNESAFCLNLTGTGRSLKYIAPSL
jgi:hypothetical protein